MSEESGRISIGAKIVREIPPEDVRERVQEFEADFDEFWIVEDCFYAGGISQLSEVMGATEQIRVGHGVAPAPFRNPAALAMEWSTIDRLHPGRLHCGLGHGVPEWMRQVGAQVASPLTLLRETTDAVRRLLGSEKVSQAGKYVKLEDVELVFPPPRILPISLGVRGPRSIRLAGEIADGAILAEWSSPAYVKWAASLIEECKEISGRDDAPRLTVFVGFCFSDDHEALAATKAAARGFASDTELHRMIRPKEVDGESVSAEQAMKEGLAVGSETEIADFLESIVDSGADAVVLEPMGNPIPQLRRLVAEVLPLVSR